ncbi:MAG: pyridoxamine 5'-phosphate oxidase family protein, partial [Actinomycetota bacterium]|nr:pyridoxamine 5'-phosphate oxidase family protein [Actinomycetota bacterium]
MPGYGIWGPTEGRGVLPWSWAEERLASSHRYWVASVGPAGQPHAMPVWGVWLTGSLWFSTGGRSRDRDGPSASSSPLTSSPPAPPGGTSRGNLTITNGTHPGPERERGRTCDAAC